MSDTCKLTELGHTSKPGPDSDLDSDPYSDRDSK